MRPKKDKHTSLIRHIRAPLLLIVMMNLYICFGMCSCAGAHLANGLFPDDAGLINVRDFGAKGDGVTDDTNAIRRAIRELPPFDKSNPWNTKIVYFPAGIYLISDTISRIDAAGNYQPGLVLIGERKEDTVLKLVDKAAGFTDTNMPKAVVFTTSGLYGGSPTAGGKNYLAYGEGNDAYGNTVENLSIDVGAGNSGAVAIDYLANNTGALRHLRLYSSSEGATGISMKRAWPGPALISDVSISGFNTGIDLARSEYSITLVNVTIDGAQRYGVSVNSNLLNFENLKIKMQAGIGIANSSPDGLIVGTGLSLGGEGTCAISNNGALAISPISVTFSSLNNSCMRIYNEPSVYKQNQRTALINWLGRPRTTPDGPNLKGTRWVNVRQFGASDSPGFDSTSSFIAAFNSGADVVYIPNGIYNVNASIPIGESVKRIEGMYSTLQIHSGCEQKQLAPCFLFVEAPRAAKDLSVARLFVKGGAHVRAIISHSQNCALSMMDIVGYGIGLLDRSEYGGPVYAENISASGRISIAGKAGAWFRQLNIEGTGGPFIEAVGAPLWILGIKTEQIMTLLRITSGATADIVGGFVYRVKRGGDEIPLIINDGGELRASFVEQSFFPDASYDTYFENHSADGVNVLKASAFDKRGIAGRIVPFLAP